MHPSRASRKPFNLRWIRRKRNKKSSGKVSRSPSESLHIIQEEGGRKSTKGKSSSSDTDLLESDLKSPLEKLLRYTVTPVKNIKGWDTFESIKNFKCSTPKLTIKDSSGFTDFVNCMGDQRRKSADLSTVIEDSQIFVSPQKGLSQREGSEKIREKPASSCRVLKFGRSLPALKQAVDKSTSTSSLQKLNQVRHRPTFVYLLHYTCSKSCIQVL